MKFLHGMTFLSIGLSIWLLGCTTLPNSSLNSSPVMSTQPTGSNPSSTQTPPRSTQTLTPQAPIPQTPTPQAPPPQATPTRPQAPQTNPSTHQGQTLPISAQVDVKGQMIQLEVARSPQEQAMGLMHRPALPDDRGMLFPMTPPRHVQFWMKNVPVGLDMVFLREGKVQAIATAPPCSQFLCPTYDSQGVVDYVIELRAGRATELGLVVGDQVTIQFLN